MTVVLPAHNRRSLVLDALRSVLRQTLRPRLVSLVDDGSSDGTGDVVRRYLAATPSDVAVEIVSTAQGGPASARNRGADLHRSGTGIIAFLDSDDIWPYDFLERGVAVLSTNGGAVAASSDLVVRDFESSSRRRLHVGGIEECPTAWLFSHRPFGISNTIVRADAFRAVGGFDEELGFGEDIDLLLRLSVRGGWRHVPGTPVLYRHGIARVRGEALHFSRTAHNRSMWRARLADRFVDALGPLADGKLGPGWERRLSDLWRRAARELSDAHRWPEAWNALSKALALQPLDPKTWAVMAQAAGRRLARFSAPASLSGT